MDVLDPAPVLASFLVTIGGLIKLATLLIERGNDRKLKRVDRIPASSPPMPEPKPVDGHLRLWALEDQVRYLGERLAEVDARRKTSDEEQQKTAAALAESRIREQALARELSDIRRALSSGGGRVDRPDSRSDWRHVDVVEDDARVTPRDGTKLR